MAKATLVIPDLHIPFEHKNALQFCKRIYKDLRCTDVVFIGDLVDNHAISYHEHDPNGWSPAEEMKEADNHLKEWFKAFPVAKLCRGNHDCYDQETEILTSNGWKLGVDLNEEDVVATLNLNSNNIEYQKPYALIKKDYNGEMIRIGKHHAVDLLVTPSHRMVVSSKDTNIDEPIYQFKKAFKMHSTYRYFPVSGSNDNKEYPIEDNQLRLLAWVLTDGYIKDNGYCICQSKEKNFDSIIKIINSCGLGFKETVRNRNITEICGRKLLKLPLPQHEFCFKSEWLDSVLNGNKKKIPDFLWSVSKRQFSIFLSSIISGDGSDYSQFNRGPGSKSLVLHGTKEFLEQVQSLCVQNMCHASLRTVREKDYRLNIVPDRIKVGHVSGNEVVDYCGIVWCASVDNGTLVVRRNGNVAIQGNCLCDRKSKTVGLPTRAFKAFRDIWNLPKGWEDDFSFIINGVKYTHGTGYSGDLAHLKAANDNRMSCVIGHLHSVAGIDYTANERDCIWGMSVGCLIDRKSYAFEYGREFKKKPILSVGVVEYTKYGANPRLFRMDM